MAKLDGSSDEEKVGYALHVLLQYGQIDGSHHKMWTIDQAVRALTGLNYDSVIAEYETCDDDECNRLGTGASYRGHCYTWDTGIAP